MTKRNPTNTVNMQKKLRKKMKMKMKDITHTHLSLGYVAPLLPSYIPNCLHVGCIPSSDSSHYRATSLFDQIFTQIFASVTHSLPPIMIVNIAFLINYYFVLYLSIYKYIQSTGGNGGTVIDLCFLYLQSIILVYPPPPLWVRGGVIGVAIVGIIGIIVQVVIIV